MRHLMWILHSWRSSQVWLGVITLDITLLQAHAKSGMPPHTLPFREVKRVPFPSAFLWEWIPHSPALSPTLEGVRAPRSNVSARQHAGHWATEKEYMHSLLVCVCTYVYSVHYVIIFIFVKCCTVPDAKLAKWSWTVNRGEIEKTALAVPRFYSMASGASPLHFGAWTGRLENAMSSQPLLPRPAFHFLLLPLLPAWKWAKQTQGPCVPCLTPAYLPHSLILNAHLSPALIISHTGWFSWSFACKDIAPSSGHDMAIFKVYKFLIQRLDELLEITSDILYNIHIGEELWT